MKEIILLSKPDCPQCQSLKMFLKFALNNRYEANIEIVDKEANLEQYLELVQKHHVLSLPVLIAQDEVLRKCEPSATTSFLQKHTAK
jgi:glutaredoxin-like protein NrdH